MTPEDAYKVLTDNPFAKQYLGDFKELDNTGSLNSFKQSMSYQVRIPPPQDVTVLIEAGDVSFVTINQLRSKLFDIIRSRVMDQVPLSDPNLERWTFYALERPYAGSMVPQYSWYAAVYREKFDESLITIILKLDNSINTDTLTYLRDLADKLFFNTPSKKLDRSEHRLVFDTSNGA